MLTDLEMFPYTDRYGPTNEKLDVYLKDIFAVKDPVIPSLSSRPPI